MSKLEKQTLHGQVKKILLLTDCATVSARFCSIEGAKNCPVNTGQFFAPSLYILYAAYFNYLIRWVIATSAYECEFLAVTWHYLPSVRLDNAQSLIRL